ncbi:hypothetical protein OUZ56_004450 [Daphnia magna]|uniref:Uncharacterized protein n=1 Tax=Daphnia magna TaxID=35525 RepID=A0ABQ9YPU0_9CRUS|nr:hypothetical protein OUZ56_004450 [Daphnia magna]
MSLNVIDNTQRLHCSSLVFRRRARFRPHFRIHIQKIVAAAAAWITITSSSIKAVTQLSVSCGVSLSHWAVIISEQSLKRNHHGVREKKKSNQKTGTTTTSTTTLFNPGLIIEQVIRFIVYRAQQGVQTIGRKKKKYKLGGEIDDCEATERDRLLGTNRNHNFQITIVVRND